MSEIEEIEKEINANYIYTSLFKQREYAKILLSHIHILEEKVKELEDGFEMMKFGWNEEIKKLEQAETRINELEDAINNTGCLILKNSIGKSKEVETDLQDYRERNPLVEQL